MKKTLATVAIVGLMLSTANAQTLEGVVGDDGYITVTAVGGVVDAAGLDFQSPAGALIPNSGDAAPFQFMLSNTATQITYGNLGATVTIDGSLKTSAGYAGNPEGDLVAAWGKGGTPVNFGVSNAVVVPEPASGLMAAVGLMGLLGMRRRR